MKTKFYIFTILITAIFYSGLSSQVLDPFQPYINDAGQLISTKLPDDFIPEELKSMACPSTNNLQTPLNQNNGQRGIMFDIVALSNITINCFETNMASGTTPVRIYYKVGTHVGFQNNAAAWTLLGTAPSVTSLGNNVNTPIPLNVNISVTAQCTVAFYITRATANGPTIQYTNGTAVGAVISADANMRVLDGTGKDFLFGASFQPRRFNGRVFYTTNAAGPGSGVVNGPNAVCAGSTNTYTLSTTGWTSYTWTVPAGTTITAGQNTNSITVTSGSTSGNVCVTPVGICGPSPQVCLPVSQAPNPSSTVSSNNVACFGASTGSATINPTPAGVYSYQWSSGGNSQTATGLSAGVYTVTATNTGNCRTIQTVTITQPPSGTSANTIPTNVLCNGQSSGSATLNVVGGSSPYNYVWSNGSTNQNISNVLAGIYTVTITDVNGCTSSSSTTVNQPSVINLSSIPTNILCNSGSTGSINLSVSGGTSNYSYLWSNGSTSEDLNTLSVGSYTVTVTDANSCTLTNSVTLTQPPALQTSTLQIIPQTCTNNGSVSISASGGTSTYNYNWSNGSTTQNISGLQPGSYSLTITDSNGCTISNGPNNIINIAPPTVTLASTNNVTCNGLSNGSLSINAVGGTPQYNYIWNNGATTQNISGILAGSYSVTVTDSLGCVLNLNPLIVSQPAVLASTANVTDLLCFNDNSGAMTTSTAGGTAPYSYLWNVGLTAQNLSSASAGTYSVSITDANGCLTVINDTIIQPPLLQTSTLQIIPQTCTNNGSVTISASGGTSTYNYNWSNGSTTQNISGLQPGTYSLTITDSNGCTVSNLNNQVLLIGAQTVSINSTTNISCNGNADGSIDLNISGGTSPFVFNWSNGLTSEDLNAIPAGNYDVTVTDSLGCVVSINSISITEPAILNVITTVNDLLCNGANSGSILLNVQGGTAPYNYLWSNGATSQDLNGISGSLYGVSVTDANGCFISQNAINVFEPTAVVINNTVLVDASCGVNDGTINIDVSGGTGTLSYIWSNGETIEDISNLPQGNYIVTVTDTNNCSTSSSLLQLNGTPALVVSITSTNELCAEPGTGTINLNNVSGTAPYSYVWNNGESSENLTNLNAGFYEVTITDADNCTFFINSTISTPLVPILNAGVWPSLTTDTVLGYGDLTSLTGGLDQTAQNVNYVWSFTGNGNLNFSDLNNIETDINPDTDGDYLIFITANSLDGCTTMDTIRITVEGINPQIPTAFSPNADGSNDIFKVVDLDVELISEFKIYNRWGQLIYDDPQVAEWDGTYKGVMQNRDTYIYVISWKKSNDNELEQKRGTVTLLR